MDRPLPLLGVTLALVAVPISLFFPPSVYPSSFPLLILLLAPAFLAGFRKPGQSSPVLFFYLLLGVVASVLTSSSQHATIGMLLILLAYAAAWWAGKSGETVGQHGITWVLIVAGALLGLHGLYQVTIGLEQSAAAAKAMGAASDVVFRLKSGRAFSRFPLPAQLGAFFLLSIPVTIGFLLRTLDRKPTESAIRSRQQVFLLSFAGVALLLQCGGFVATFSLGAFLAAACGCVYLMLRQTPKRRVLIPAVAVLVVAALAAISFRPEWAGLDHQDNPVQLRLSNWSVAARMIVDHPATGVGPGCFGVRYPAYMQEGMNETKYAHNVPMQLIAEGGLWVVVPLLLAFGFLLRALRRAQSWKDRLTAAAILSFVIANLWDFHLYLPSLGIPFFFLFGNWAGQEEELPSSRSMLGFTRLRLVAGTVLMIGAAAWLTHVDQLRLRTLDAVAAGQWQEGLTLVADWQRADPWDAGPHGLEAELRSARINPGEGLPAAGQALIRDPWMPFRHAVVSRELEARGSLTSALIRMRQASILFPIKENYTTETVRLSTQLKGAAR